MRVRADADKQNESGAPSGAGIPRYLRQPALPLLLLFLAVFAPNLAHAQSAKIIVNPALEDVPLNRDLLRAIFTMQLRAWPNGPPVRVFVLPDSNPLSDQFYREQLGIYSYMLRAAWDRMVFTGTGLAPTVVKSEQEMRQRVRATPGAIGYVSRDNAAEILPGISKLQIASTEAPRL